MRQALSSRIFWSFFLISVLLPALGAAQQQPQKQEQKQAQSQPQAPPQKQEAAAKPALPATPAGPRVLSARDTLRISQVSSPRLSPDGKWVLYTQSARDMDDKEMKTTTHIWRVRLDGSERRQMTQGQQSSTSPAWLPDGKRFAFLSDRGKAKPLDDQAPEPGEGPKNQIFFIYADGGEAWQVTDHAESI